MFSKQNFFRTIMANLKEVKTRIQSVSSTQQITKSMKMVAAAKLRKAQDKIINMRPYTNSLVSVVEGLEFSEQNSIYTQSRPSNKVLLVVITSDRGLCGGFNSSVIKKTHDLITKQYAKQKVSLLCIGKKGSDMLKKRYSVNSDYIDLFHNLTFEETRKASNFIMASFRNKVCDHVALVYNKFKNVATQVLTVQDFLPLNLKVSKSNSQTLDYIFEPDKNTIVEQIIPKLLRIQLHAAILESNASEQGARMTAMDKATENAAELLKDLRLVYNRTRQAAITKEILEIVGGAEALNQS